MHNEDQVEHVLKTCFENQGGLYQSEGVTFGRWELTNLLSQDTENPGMDNRIELPKLDFVPEHLGCEPVSVEFPMRSESLWSKCTSQGNLNLWIGPGQLGRNFIGREDGTPAFPEQAANSGLSGPDPAGYRNDKAPSVRTMCRLTSRMRQT